MSSPTIYKGQTWKRRLTVTNQKDGTPYDLTGASISFRGKHRTSDDTALVDLAIGTGIALLTQSGDTLGQADITIDGGISSAFDDSVDSLVCAAIVVLLTDTEPKIVLPPFRVPVRDLP